MLSSLSLSLAASVVRSGAGRLDTSAEPLASEQAPTRRTTEDSEEGVRRLRQRDQEVRAHERAHMAAGGHYAGSPRYEYERGPDGRHYAVGGSVAIDTSPVHGDPEATAEKMQVVRRAALAPAKPSAKDRRVAAEASRREAEARRELAVADHSQASTGQQSRGDACDAPAAADADKGPSSSAPSAQEAPGAGFAALLSQTRQRVAASCYGRSETPRRDLGLL